MQKLNEKGAIGVLEMVLIGVIVLVVGFAGYRIAQVNSNAEDSANKALESSESLVDTIKVTEAEDSAKEVEVPKDEDKKEEVDTSDDEKKVEDPKEEEKKEKDYTNISMSITELTQDATTITATATLDQNRSGVCTAKLYKDGQDKIYKDINITSKKTCTAVFDKSDVPVDGDWQMHMWFANTDHTFKGWAETQNINVTL